MGAIAFDLLIRRLENRNFTLTRFHMSAVTGRLIMRPIFNPTVKFYTTLNTYDRKRARQSKEDLVHVLGHVVFDSNQEDEEVPFLFKLLQDNATLWARSAEEHKRRLVDAKESDSGASAKKQKLR